MRASIAFIAGVGLQSESSSLLEDGLYEEPLAGSLRLFFGVRRWIVSKSVSLLLASGEMFDAFRVTLKTISLNDACSYWKITTDTHRLETFGEHGSLLLLFLIFCLRLFLFSDSSLRRMVGTTATVDDFFRGEALDPPAAAEPVNTNLPSSGYPASLSPCRQRERNFS